MASLGLSLALAAVVALTRHQAAGAGGALRLDETSGPSMPSYSSDEWRIEKYTINILSTQGTAMSTHEWIAQYLCTPKTTCPSDLGCGNMRVWCTIGSPYSALEFMNNTFELHWVSAPTLQDLTVGESKTRATDAWIGYLEELNGDDMRFSAFSHNKVQLFARNVTAYAERFAAGGVPTLKRLSYDAAGVAVAHVSVAVAGRVYEIVGAATGAETAWPAWSSAECAPAHGLPDTVAFYDGAAKTAFWRERGFGFGELLVVNIGASFRYVDNSSPQIYSGNRTLETYDNFFAESHHTFATNASGGWYAWDHGLDQHVGLWYGGAEQDCLDRATAMRSLLEKADLGVGERGEPDAHEVYTGYAGPMTWQYQFPHCDAGRPDAPEECACVATNNLDDYGKTACTAHSDEDDWCGL
ncbi:hypothetical protein SO694_00100063 [Aureococcus anophagefferens]|uniref:Uncharacterized protein n=1 Tax=Aureococcus anophagefferens TaxID=44056 RepID=A0ABR1FN23_AURAN